MSVAVGDAGIELGVKSPSSCRVTGPKDSVVRVNPVSRVEECDPGAWATSEACVEGERALASGIVPVGELSFVDLFSTSAPTSGSSASLESISGRLPITSSVCG